MTKRIMKLAALLLAMCLLLTGCSMIEVDREMDDAEIVVKVGETEMNKKEVMQRFDYVKSRYQQNQLMYSNYGLTVAVPSDDEIKQIVIDGLVLNEVRKQTAQKMGLDQLTEDELAQVQENAQANYDEYIEELKAYVTKDGMTDEEIEAAVKKFMDDNELTMDLFVEDATEDFIDNKECYLLQDILQDLVF